MDMSSEFCGACGAVLLLCAGGATACDVCGSSLPNEEAGGGLKLVTRRRLAPSETLRQLTEAATDVGGAQEAVVRCGSCVRGGWWGGAWRFGRERESCGLAAKWGWLGGGRRRRRCRTVVTCAWWGRGGGVGRGARS